MNSAQSESNSRPLESVVPDPSVEQMADAVDVLGAINSSQPIPD